MIPLLQIIRVLEVLRMSKNYTEVPVIIHYIYSTTAALQVLSKEVLTSSIFYPKTQSYPNSI